MPEETKPAALVTLHDKDGNPVLPQTAEKAVYDDEGVLLSAKLTTLSEHLSDTDIHVTAADRTQWSGKAAPSRTEYHTLTADGWTEQADGTFTQVVTLKSAVIGDPPIDIGEVTIGITAELLAAVESAKIIPTAVSDTVITVTAFGTKPAVDIPIFVTVGS